MSDSRQRKVTPVEPSQSSPMLPVTTGDSLKGPGSNFNWSWLHIGELVFLGFMVAEFMSVHVTNAAGTISDTCLNAPACAAKLHDGLTFNRKNDLSDLQWRDFRKNLPILAVFASLFLVLSHLVRRKVASHMGRVFFYCLISAAFLVYLNGAYSILVFSLTVPCFVLALALKESPLAPILTWVYCMVILFTNEWYHDNYKFSLLGPQFAWMDEHRGPVRWHVSFNMIVLRMISFNMDYYWALKAKHDRLKDREREPLKKELNEGGEEAELKKRVQEPLELEHYSLLFYCAYLFYVPLHVAGPTMTFNSFASQVISAPTHIKPRYVAIYFLRFLFGLAIMEFATHYLYCYALTKSGAYTGFSPFYIGMLGYLSLHMIWLKFFIIWRFFRLWALLDNIETVENMNRCMSNNYNLQGFWRSWHRSFNRWLIRYIYIPLGGKKRNLVNTFVVFTFTALWHDLTMNLLAWGWLIVLFILPETFFSYLFNRKELAGFRARWYYRYVCALGAALNIMLMMIANLVGFSAGTIGVKAYLALLFSFEGLPFLLISTFYLVVGALVMFEVREYEARNNISKGF